MVIFVNNKPIHLVQSDKIKVLNINQYDVIIDGKNSVFKPSVWSGEVLVQNTMAENITSFFKFAKKNSLDHLSSVTFLVKDKATAKSEIKQLFSVVKAAGGMVFNAEGKVLMMKRLGFWDLPKGKAESDENSKLTAIREVEEECGVKVKIDKKLCTTWHTYLLKGKPVIKRTKWYAMTLLDDRKMKPQAEEGIEELRWMTPEEMEEALKISYASIIHVVKSAHQATE